MKHWPPPFWNQKWEQTIQNMMLPIRLDSLKSILKNTVQVSLPLSAPDRVLRLQAFHLGRLRVWFPRTSL